MLTKGTDIFMKDKFGQSPFFYACREGKSMIFDFFIENKADVNETDNYKQTPLFYASRDG